MAGSGPGASGGALEDFGELEGKSSEDVGKGKGEHAATQDVLDGIHVEVTRNEHEDVEAAGAAELEGAQLTVTADSDTDKKFKTSSRIAKIMLLINLVF